MANPFAIFRKNQRAWMAGLVLVALFAFVIAPAFQYAKDSIGGSAGGGNEVAVKWKGGSLTLASLQNGIVQHTSLVRFMQEVARRVLENGGRPDVPGFSVDPQSGQILALGIQFSSRPEDIVRTKVLASHARSQGVAFTDDAVDEFIQQYVDDKLSSEEVASILSDSSNGQLSYFEIREMLKDELSSLVVQQMAVAGLLTQSQNRQEPLVSPGKLFSDFMKLNQTAKVEAFPVLVDEYIDEVAGEPTDSEIEAIYQIGSMRAANPNSPDPGFIRLYKTNVEYVEASLQAWIDREKEKLTEEDIRKEYDRRVELGQLKVPVEKTEETGTEEAAAETADESSPDAPTEAASEDGDQSEPAAEISADTEESTSSESEAAKSEGSAKVEEEAAKKTDADDTTTPGSEDQSNLENESSTNVRLVSMVQEESGSATSTEPATSQTESEAPAAQEETSSAEESMPVDAQTGTSETTEGEEAADTPETPAEPEMRVQTFEEAKDAIASDLARDKAIPALDEALTSLLEDTMRPFYGEYRQFAAFQDSSMSELSDAGAEEPKRPDLKQLAEAAGLKWGETGLVDGVTLAQMPFGLGNIRPDESGINGSVANVVVQQSIDLFRPLQSSYFDQAALAEGKVPEFLQYLLWKSEDQAAYVPSIDEVRGEIVDAWKRIKARELAAQAAEDLAKKIGSGEDAWAAALSTSEQSLVIESSPFTWMNRMGEFMTTSVVNKLDNVSGEFMREVFVTPVGAASVAPNANRSTYYVFRVVEMAPGAEDLQARFQADPVKSGPQRIARSETQQQLLSWVEQLETSMELEWQMNVGQFN
ncbi:MAG: hypothetical protein AB8B50_11925 [Pirellulaceae bacterium]